MARYSMENGHKATALFVIALVSALATVGLVIACWFKPPPSGEVTALIVGAVVFFENVVVAIVGFFTGASRPDATRPEELPRPGAP